MLQDIMQLRKLEKEQLIELCELLFTFLQKKEVTVNVQSTPPITWNIPNSPLNLPLVSTPALPFPYGKITYQNTDTKVDFQASHNQ